MVVKAQKKYVYKEPIPSLTCIKKPSKRQNDGIYTVTIPIAYLIKAIEVPAAFYKFKFVGLRYE
jgi:hypothetical protein